MKPFKVTFHMDGSGVVMFPNGETMLDSLIEWALHENQPPDFLPSHRIKNLETLPLEKWELNGFWGWKASGIIPEGEIAFDTQHYRKRFAFHRFERLCKGSVNTTMGTYRIHNVPMPLMLCHKMIAYGVGDIPEVKKALSRVKGLGKRIQTGKGRVEGLTIEEIEKDCSCVKDGVYMRYLPTSEGSRFGRVRPPYWNAVDRTYTCRPGDLA